MLNGQIWASLTSSAYTWINLLAIWSFFLTSFETFSFKEPSLDFDLFINFKAFFNDLEWCEKLQQSYRNFHIFECNNSIRFQESASFAESLLKMFDVESQLRFGNSQAILDAFKKVIMSHRTKIYRRLCMRRFGSETSKVPFSFAVLRIHGACFFVTSLS